MTANADVTVEQRPSWQAFTTQEPFHIRDWKTDDRVPAGLKQGIAIHGLDIGPLVFVPLTTPHRRLGALGMSGRPGTAYTCDDISFLRLIGRVVVFRRVTSGTFRYNAASSRARLSVFPFGTTSATAPHSNAVEGRAAKHEL